MTYKRIEQNGRAAGNSVRTLVEAVVPGLSAVAWLGPARVGSPPVIGLRSSPTAAIKSMGLLSRVLRSATRVGGRALFGQTAGSRL